MKKIFIVGCGHSGTSLMIRILDAHSDTYAIPFETGIFLNNNEDIIKNEIDKFEEIAKKKGATCLVEKTPKHTHKIQSICKLYPEVKIIAMIRDSRDVACSLKARGFTFEEGLERWIEDNNALLLEKERRNLLFIKLEEFIINQDAVIKKILDFADLSMEDLTKYYTEKKKWYAIKVIANKPMIASGKEHEKLRNWQINQPIFKTTQRHSQEMTEEDKYIFEKKYNEIEVLMKMFDYKI